MAEYMLVGAADDKGELWFINKKEGTATKVPEDVALHVVSVFQSQIKGAGAAAENKRDKLAQSILDNVANGNAVSRGIILSFSANQLGALVLGKRSSPVRKVFHDKAPLSKKFKTIADKHKAKRSKG